MSRLGTKMLLATMCVLQLAVCGYLIHRWEAVLQHGEQFKFITRPVDPYDAFRGKYVAINLEHNFLSLDKPPAHDTWMPGQRVYVTITANSNGFARLTQAFSQPPPDGSVFVKATVQYLDTSMNLMPGDIINPLSLANRMQVSEDVISKRIREVATEYEKDLISQSISNNVAMPSLAETLAQLLNRMEYDSEVTSSLNGHPSIDYADHSRWVRETIQGAYPGELAPISPARLLLKLPFDRFYMEESRAGRAEQAYWDHSRSSSAERTYITVRILNGVGVIENLWIGDKPINDYLRDQAKK